MLSKQPRGIQGYAVGIDLFPGLPPDQPGVLVQPECNEEHALGVERYQSLPWRFIECPQLLEVNSIYDIIWFEKYGTFPLTFLICCFHWRCWGTQFCFGFGFSIGSQPQCGHVWASPFINLSTMCASLTGHETRGITRLTMTFASRRNRWWTVMVHMIVAARCIASSSMDDFGHGFAMICPK